MTGLRHPTVIFRFFPCSIVCCSTTKSFVCLLACNVECKFCMLIWFRCQMGFFFDLLCFSSARYWFAFIKCIWGKWNQTSWAKNQMGSGKAQSSFKDSSGNWCTSMRANLIELGSRSYVWLFVSAGIRLFIPQINRFNCCKYLHLKYAKQLHQLALWTDEVHRS